jgi:hypothetical protein
LAIWEKWKCHVEARNEKVSEERGRGNGKKKKPQTEGAGEALQVKGWRLFNAD